MSKASVTTNIDPNKRYALLQLTPELEASLNEGSLTFRGGLNSQLRICTNEKTHDVRKLKQSNTLLLAHTASSNQNEKQHESEKELEVQVFATPYEILETVETSDISIDWSQFPVYTNLNTHGIPVTASTNEFCSPVQYKDLARQKPVLEVNNESFVLDADTVHDLIVELFSIMIEIGDLQLQSPFEVLKPKLETEQPEEVAKAVYDMFLIPCNEENSSELGIDLISLSKWIGLYILNKSVEGIELSDFISQWSKDLPLKLDTNINLLRGHAVEFKKDWLIPFNGDSLPVEIKLRLDQLFKIKLDWPIQEIEPFLRPVMPQKQIFEKWVMKYTRKHKVLGTGVCISPRR